MENYFMHALLKHAIPHILLAYKYLNILVFIDKL